MELNGVIITAFGQRYVDLAHQVARTLRKTNPGLDIDLFTGAEVDAGVFSQVHVLPDLWVRSKLDSMLQSRFDRTLFLDADLLVVADLSDIFVLFDRFDIAVAQDMYRSSAKARVEYRRPFPNTFPQLNSGVFGFRRSEAMTRFLQVWKADVQSHGIGKDQPSLRELIWTTDLRVAILPPEYNLYDHHSADVMVPGRHAAPRVLHSHRLLRKPLPTGDRDPVVHYFGAAIAYKLRLLLAGDETLARHNGAPARRPSRREKLHLAWLYLLYGMGRLVGRG